jgi:CheY-like chemotaxis protein
MTQSGQRRSPSVLVTDDTEATREVVARLLAAEGYAVDTAAHGPEALEKLASVSSISICWTSPCR